MAKFHGGIGFVEYEETAPGVFTEKPTIRVYSGDLLRRSNRYALANNTINDNLVINNQVSIVADPYINQHFPSIRFIEWKGCRWKVTNVDDSNPPRIILTMGDVYNGEQT